MSMLWLADVDKDTFWAHQPWTEFGSSRIDDHAVAVLPIYAFADHGLGLPLDSEEVLGSFVLKHAVPQLATSVKIRVLPALRFALAPYSSCVFGVDPETAHKQILEICEGVKAAGFHKLVFFSTSPWNIEFIDATSRDVRVQLGLQTFVIDLNGLGLSFHPGSEDRAKAQSAVAKRLGETPRPAPRSNAGTTASGASDLGFRPGNYRNVPHLPPGPPVDGTFFANQASDKVADMLLEIAARTPVSGGARRTGLELKRRNPDEPDDATPVFPQGFRSRYLPAMHREDWDRIGDRSKAWVIIPTASIEQHGPHLPVGVDAMLGHAWVTQTVGRFPAGAKVYVAPPITYGKSNEHMGFPGTLSISGTTFRRTLVAIVTQLKAAGFRQMAVLNSHGGNSAVLVYTMRELQSTLDVRIGMLGQPYKPEQTPVEVEMGFHAGEWETSLMLAIASDLVQMDKAVSEYPPRREELGPVRFSDAPGVVSWMTSDISESGVMGDAKSATLEKGQHWLERGAAAIAQKLGALDDSR